jgi:hypothetical protein
LSEDCVAAGAEKKLKEIVQIDFSVEIFIKAREQLFHQLKVSTRNAKLKI